MGNPITDLWHVAVSGWDRLAYAYGNTWRDMYDVVDFYKWKAEVQTAFQELGQAVEFVAVLNATSAADTVQIGRDTAVNFRNALTFLRDTYIPAIGRDAYRQATWWALQSDWRFWHDLVRRIAIEHHAMEIRVLEEQMAREVANAKLYAHFATAIAIERYERTLMVNKAVRDLTALITRTRADILAKLAQAVRQLTQQVDQVRAYAQSIPGLVDQRAVNGYNPTRHARAGILQRLLDTAVAHDPLVAGLVSKLAGWLIDLAEIDDPLVRLAAQLVLKQLIDRLGLDTALGAMVNDLVGGLLGTGPPKSLLDVTRDVGNRLDAAESALGGLAPLAPEADQLREMGTLAFDVALLGYLAGAVADPRAAADDTAAALDTVTGPLLAPVRALLGVP